MYVNGLDENTSQNNVYVQYNTTNKQHRVELTPLGKCQQLNNIYVITLHDLIKTV